MGQSALYVPGVSGKFEHLFSWVKLNHLLEFGGLSFPRLRLFRGGQEIPKASYFTAGRSGYERPLVRGLTTELCEGAMLTIESIEELHEPISVQCRVLERSFGIPVQADLYASCRDRPTPPLRQNDHDVIVLQLEGARRWQLYFPINRRAARGNGSLEPVAAPAWEGVVDTHDLLYVPKGWRYCDEPAGEHGVCLALKFRNPTALDVVSRLVVQLGVSRKMSASIPRFADAERQGRFLRDVQQKLAEAVTHPGLLAGYLTGVRFFAEPRHAFSLPWAGLPSPLPPADDWVLTPLLGFPASDSLVHSELEDVCEIVVDRQVVRFSEDVADVVQSILDSESTTVGSLISAFASSVPAERILECVSELVKCGAVCFREPGFRHAANHRLPGSGVCRSFLCSESPTRVRP